jgi:hypothetical protein
VVLGLFIVVVAVCKWPSLGRVGGGTSGRRHRHVPAHRFVRSCSSNRRRRGTSDRSQDVLGTWKEWLNRNNGAVMAII